MKELLPACSLAKYQVTAVLMPSPWQEMLSKFIIEVQLLLRHNMVVVKMHDIITGWVKRVQYGVTTVMYILYVDSYVLSSKE